MPADNPNLMFLWPDVLKNIEKQLSNTLPTFGEGQTLVFSMLTDGFSPHLVQTGVTEAALKFVMDFTQFRVRILTKNAIVGSDKWLRFFNDHPNRYVAGLSTGTMDDQWAKQIELFTALPSRRLKAAPSPSRCGCSHLWHVVPDFSGRVGW